MSNEEAKEYLLDNIRRTVLGCRPCNRAAALARYYRRKQAQTAWSVV